MNTDQTTTPEADEPQTRHKAMAATSTRGQRTAAGQLPAQRRHRRANAMLRAAHRKPRAKR